MEIEGDVFLIPPDPSIHTHIALRDFGHPIPLSKGLAFAQPTPFSANPDAAIYKWTERVLKKIGEKGINTTTQRSKRIGCCCLGFDRIELDFGWISDRIGYWDNLHKETQYNTNRDNFVKYKSRWKYTVRVGTSRRDIWVLGFLDFGYRQRVWRTRRWQEWSQYGKHCSGYEAAMFKNYICLSNGWFDIRIIFYAWKVLQNEIKSNARLNIDLSCEL